MGRHSAPAEGNAQTPMRTPASTSIFGRKKELKRLDAENEAMFSDNRRLYADNQRLYADNVAMHQRLQELGAMSIMEREALIRKLDEDIKAMKESARQEEESIRQAHEKLAKELDVEIETARQSAARERESFDQERESRAKAIDIELADRRTELEKLDKKVSDLHAEEELIRGQILDVREQNELQDMGLFDYRNMAEDSVTLSAKLADNKQRQRQMVKDKRAVLCIGHFTFNNSVAKGRTFLNDMCRMALSLYNTEAENCVKSVKAGNLQTSIARLDRCDEKISRFGKFIDLKISREYRQLRVEELELTARHMQALQAEKEAERERKAELREQAKAQRELEAEMARLKKEQEHYRNVLAKMQEQGNAAEAIKLEEKLAQIGKSIDDVDYRAANIRAGYVYVVSDVGAFGERMVKIGMTRRLEPLDRIRELSGASVPFKFDVHALFFSQDAVSLETMLHHEFEDRRVNKVNARKEFFYVTPQEVLDKLREKDVAVVEYRVEPEAEEYRISQQLAEKNAPTA